MIERERTLKKESDHFIKYSKVLFDEYLLF